MRLAQVFLFGCSLTLLSACTSTPMNQSTSVSTPHLQNQATLSVDDIVSTFQNGEPMECVFESERTHQNIDARIEKNKILLSDVNFGDNVSTGIILISDSIAYAWKDGSTTGWTATLPSSVSTKDLFRLAQNKGLGLTDITSNEGIKASIESGDTVQCIRTQLSQDTFSPRESIEYTDATSIVNHFFQ